MIAHEDATTADRNVFESDYLGANSSGPNTCADDTHGNAVEGADVSDKNRIRYSDESGDRPKDEIDE